MISIIHYDAISFLREMPDNSINMVFTDPPYGHNNNNNGDLISRREAALGRGDYLKERDDRPICNDGKEANNLFRSILPEIKRVLVPGGCCCCCGGGGGPEPQFARWSLWLDEVLDFKQMVVWDKGRIGMGWHYRRSYETILVAQKPGRKCAWYDTSHKIENIIRPGYRGIKKIIPRKDQHPTQKPVELSKFFIELHSQEGDVVLDPFCGSGSTLIAAEELGRNSIGIELDKVWFDMAEKRVFQLGYENSFRADAESPIAA